VTSRAVTLTLASNELRALLPAWIIGVLAASLAALTHDQAGAGLTPLTLDAVHGLSLVACVAATMALGARSIGHEYTHRTLGLTLMLPVGRGRLFLIKLGVLAALVVPLAAFMWLLDLFESLRVLPWLSAGAALFLAPAWTMLTRNQLAGATFAVSVPGVVLVVLAFLYDLFDQSTSAERAAREIWAWLMIPMLAGGAVLGWRQFMRLQAIDGGVLEHHLEWWIRTPRSARTERPLWLLVKKELNLQKMTLVLTALYIAVSMVAILYQARLEADPQAPAVIGVASAIYWLGLPVLIGALAAAEERQLGTLSWQLHLPKPVWQQWAVKAGTTFSLALLLAVGVPMLIARLFWPAQTPNARMAIILVMVTTASSLFVSSVCATTVRAAIASLLAIPAGLWLVVMTAVAFRGGFATDFWSGREDAWLILVSLVVALLVGFAYVNHRPEPPAAARVRRQALYLAALMGVGLLIIEAIPRIGG
jgi:hypothetical protein